MGDNAGGAVVDVPLAARERPELPRARRTVAARLGLASLATARGLLLASSFAFLMAGTVALSAGIAARVSLDFSALVDVPDTDHLAVCFVAIGVAVVVFATAAFSGVLTRSRRLIVVATVTLGLLLVAQLVVGVLGYVYADRAPGLLDVAWTYTRDYNRCSIQYHLGCCGFADPTDRPCAASACPAAPLEGSGAVAGCAAPLEASIAESLRSLGVAGIVAASMEAADFVLMCGLLVAAAMSKRPPPRARRGADGADGDVLLDDADAVGGEKNA